MSDDPFKNLREAQDKLSTRLTRLNLTRFGIVLVLALTFSRAFEKIGAGEFSKLRKECEQLSCELVQKPLNLNIYRGPFDFSRTKYGGEEIGAGPQCATLPASPTPDASPQPDANAEAASAATPQPSPASRQAGMPSAASQAEPTGAERKRQQEEERAALEARQEKLETCTQGLEERTDKAFLFEMAVLDAKLDFDLRTWIYALPFALIISEAYFYVLRRKIGALGALGAKIVKATGDTTSALDKLTFPVEPGQRSPFASNAWQFEILASTLGTWGLMLYLVPAGRPLWQNWSPYALIPICTVLAIFTFYAVAYARAAAAEIEEAALLPPEWRRQPGLPTRLWERVRGWGEWCGARVGKPAVSLPTGAGLVLASLFLLTTADGCFTAQTGYEYLRQNPCIVPDEDHAAGGCG
ncbi:MAG: hypothetical protein LC774_07265, partial [Acidobacteria bacterium]|nr:hypothetical protein [Acidobacteriota bacterium]